MKAVWVVGLDELEKLEGKSGRVKYQFVVPKAKIDVSRNLVITNNHETNGPAVIKGTADYVIICRLRPHEFPPDDLPVVTQARL